MHSKEVITAALHDYEHRTELSVREIADQHGVSVTALLSWAKRARLPQRPHGRPRMDAPTPRQRKILEMVSQHSFEDVAQHFKVKKQEIWRIAERWRNHVKPRQPPYEPGDIIQCNGRTYTVYAADFFCGSLMDDHGRFIPRFAWKRGALIEKVGKTTIDPSWYDGSAKAKRSRPRRRRQPPKRQALAAA